jgi:hypothetical protein
VLVPGTVVCGVVALGAVLVCGVVALGAVLVWLGAIPTTVLVTVLALGTLLVEFPARAMSAAAITPSDRATTTASTAIGFFQSGEAARRVRAAAPQRTHHSCSGCSGAPHSGQASPGEDGGGKDGGAGDAPAGGGVATLMSPIRGDG